MEEDEFDKILNSFNSTNINDEKDKTKPKNKLLTIDFYKRILITIYSFFYLFFYSLIYPPKPRINDEQNSTNPNNQNNRRNIDQIRRPGHFRYRSPGGG